VDFAQNFNDPLSFSAIEPICAVKTASNKNHTKLFIQLITPIPVKPVDM
jgi:hypothetical protein